MAIRGLLFDKDGTLFDFNSTWGRWTAEVIREFTTDATLQGRLARRLGYDLAAERFLPDSVVIAGTPQEVAELAAQELGRDASELAREFNERSARVTQVEAVPLVPFLSALRADGFALGVATNDAEGPARAHLERAGVIQLFDFIAGYDSGYGAKPAPGMCLAFCEATGLAPDEVAMIGDSPHDLLAAKAAGMHPIGVETGPYPRAEIAPLAEKVFFNISGLVEWLKK